jgi:hypothetical protein
VIADIINNQVNNVKLSNSLSSRKGRDIQMAMVLKIGAGGDAQNHVSTPVSIKESSKLDQEPIKKNAFSQRASSA